MNEIGRKRSASGFARNSNQEGVGAQPGARRARLLAPIADSFQHLLPAGHTVDPVVAPAVGSMTPIAATARSLSPELPLLSVGEFNFLRSALEETSSPAATPPRCYAPAFRALTSQRPHSQVPATPLVPPPPGSVAALGAMSNLSWQGPAASLGLVPPRPTPALLTSRQGPATTAGTTWPHQASAPVAASGGTGNPAQETPLGWLSSEEIDSVLADARSGRFALPNADPSAPAPALEHTARDSEHRRLKEALEQANANVVSLLAENSSLRNTVDTLQRENAMLRGRPWVSLSTLP